LDWLRFGASPGDAPPGAVQIGHFVVLRVLGSGGMGIVYSAYDEKLDRKVAVKLLRGDLSTQTPRRQTRMVREAQAMAKLSHPNVVQIYEVGTHGGQIFLAMEFVEGGSLRRWLKDEDRSWREVLGMFIQAGRGLAAAHRAGIVHRDFKPDNVLVDKTGTAKVTDFGTARAAVLSGGHAPVSDENTEEPTEEPTVSGSASMLDQRLTITGRAVGTPAYMSPEQHFGDPVDARSDQFGFCVALFEALYGDRPFRGSDRAALAARVAEGTIPDPPPGTKVPSWVRRAVLRGLSSEPENRFPDMDALLAELDRDPHRGRKWLAAGAVAAVLLGGAPFVLTGDAPCQDMDAPLLGVWDEARKESIEQAFLATKLPFAADAWKSVEASFDHYTRAWVETRTQACEATHEGSQSADMLDLRMACLDRRLGSLSSLTELFANADPQVVENAAEAASSLPDLAFCNNTEALRLAVRPPEDPETARKVEELRATLDQVASLELAGRYKESLTLAEEAVETARTIDYDPVLAEALYRLGKAQSDLRMGSKTADTLKEAVDLAERSRHDELAADAWIDLIRVAGSELNKPEEGRAHYDRARAAIFRVGDDQEKIAQALNARGHSFYLEGRYAEAEADFDEALRIRTARGDDVRTAETIRMLAYVHAASARPAEALRLYERALEITSATLGSSHPNVATLLLDIGGQHVEMGAPDKGAPYLERARSVLAGTYGETHPEIGVVHLYLVKLALARGDVRTARTEAERALSLIESGPEPDERRRLEALNALGAVLFMAGEYEGSLEAYRKAISLSESVLGPEHVHVGMALSNLGETLVALERFNEAADTFRRALSIIEPAVSELHEFRAFVLKGMGQALLGLRQYPNAVEALEEALRVRRANPANSVEMADVEWSLARALRASHTDEARARELALAAKATFAKIGDQARTAEIDTWIRR